MRERMLSMINGAWACQAVAVACELDIPDRLAESPRDAASLAADTGMHAPSMRRFLRALCALEVCEERGDGRFALATGGDWLRRERPGSLHGWAVLSGRRLWGLWGDLGEGLRTGESVRRRRKGFGDFGELGADPAMAAVFNRAMISVTDPVANAFVRQVPLEGVAHAVDVGGGPGELLATVLAANPSMRGVVYDLPHARTIAEETLRRHGVADRAAFVQGSFFDAVPEGAHAYFLKSVLHNWDDERAARILDRCAAAMSRDGRLMLLERVLPPRLSTSARDRDAARSDLQMLLGCDGRERTLAEFDAMLAASGFVRGGMTPLTDDFTLIEAAIAG
ncbi:MAG TPA: methyltransferase [Usitatibacter sp.]|nr:methyltransferase [Usitatibacter sp.]